MKTFIYIFFAVITIFGAALSDTFAQTNTTIDNETLDNTTEQNLFTSDNQSTITTETAPILDDTELINTQNPQEDLLDICSNQNLTLTPYRKQYINITSENDAYYNAYRDRYYTAGNRIGYTSKEEDYFCQNVRYKLDPEHKRSKLWWLSKISALQKRHLTRWDIHLAQEMYTPKNKFAPLLGETDYPYSGYLYLAFGFSNRDENTEERFQLNLGVVGPASLAQHTQDFIHTVFGLGSKLPWQSPLHNEPIINLHYQITTRFYLFNTPYFSSDILPGISAALGNAHTYAALSLRLRLGYNLDVDFGVTKMNHGMDSTPPHSDKFSIYVFGGGSGRFVVKNIFISGNTFQNNTNLDITRFIYDLEAGLAISFKGIRLSYTFSHRSKEFRGQAGDMNFSSISMQIAF